MEKTLYIHVGTQKTGTTAIQGFLTDNREILREKGYAYPIFPYYYPRVSEERNAHFLVGRILDENGNRCKDIEQKNYREAMDYIVKLFEEVDYVVLSDEHIWQSTLRDYPFLWDDLKKESEKAGFRIKIIVYLRRQDDYAASLWNQIIKTAIRKDRHTQTFDEFIAKPPRYIQLDYYKKLESIAAVLGKDNIVVRVFERERFYGGSVYADFLKSIGLELTDDFQIFYNEKNGGLTGNTHEIKRILNSLPELADGEANNMLRNILLECADISAKEYPTMMYSEEQAKEFLAKYSESNQRILKEYLHEEGTELFSAKIKELPKWEKDNPHMQDDLIRFVGMVAIHFWNENKKRKAEIEALKEAQKRQKMIPRMKRKIKNVFGKDA